MEILFVCRFLPHREVRDSGGQDTYHYISSLSERHAVSVIGFVPKGQESAVAAMGNTCRNVVGVPYEGAALLPRLWRALWRVLLPRVYGRAISVRYASSLRSLAGRQRFDVAIVDGPMAPYGRLLHGPKKVLDEVDIYSAVAYQLYRNEPRRLPRWWALLDWLRLQASELHYAGSYDAVMVRSDRDRLILKGYLPGQRIEVASPWFEGLDSLKALAPGRPDGNRLLFVGAMNLPANIEAVVYFCREVLPLVRQRVGDAELWIVGGAPAPEVRRLAGQEGVVVTGEVPDLTPYYRDCVVNVVPLLRGGGIIAKTLNGLAAGRPTVATQAGNSGTGAMPGRDLVVVDRDAGVLAAAIVSLLDDREQWERLAANGKKFVAEHFDWGEVMRKLEGLIEKVTRQA